MEADRREDWALMMGRSALGLMAGLELRAKDLKEAEAALVRVWFVDSMRMARHDVEDPRDAWRSGRAEEVREE